MSHLAVIFSLLPVAFRFTDLFFFLRNVMWVMSTQLIVISTGGICKRLHVSAPSLIWPDNPVTAVLFNACIAKRPRANRAAVAFPACPTLSSAASMVSSSCLGKWSHCPNFYCFQTSHRLISLLLSRAFRGFAGWLPTMLRSTSSLASSPGLQTHFFL
jgi:hypothetical protein